MTPFLFIYTYCTLYKIPFADQGNIIETLSYINKSHWYGSRKSIKCHWVIADCTQIIFHPLHLCSKLYNRWSVARLRWWMHSNGANTWQIESVTEWPTFSSQYIYIYAFFSTNIPVKFKLHWSLFPRIWLTERQHSFRRWLDVEPLPEPMIT